MNATPPMKYADVVDSMLKDASETFSQQRHAQLVDALSAGLVITLSSVQEKHEMFAMAYMLFADMLMKMGEVHKQADERAQKSAIVQ